MYNVLRQLVKDELSARPAFVLGRVESVNALSGSEASFRGAANNATGVRTLTQDMAEGDNGVFIHLGTMQAPMFWQPSNLSVGGSNPPVISV